MSISKIYHVYDETDYYPVSVDTSETPGDHLPGVLQSAQYITTHAIHVKPSEKGIQETAQMVTRSSMCIVSQ